MTMQTQKQQPQLAGMIKGQMFEGYLLVRTAEQRTAANGTKYLDLNLSDLSGEVNGKMWDGNTKPPEVSSVIKVRAMMNEYNGRAQLRVDKLRTLNEGETVDMSLLVPTAPDDPEIMANAIRERVEAFADPELKALVSKRLDECGGRLMYYPAAVKLHHAERSGLLHHTSTMLRAAEAICGIYPQLDADLLAAGVILHDLCKIQEMDASTAGLASTYTAEGQQLGHLVMGVTALDRAGRELGTRKELLLLLEHMILSHHDLPEYGSPKQPMFPEAEVLHVLDLLDARLFEMGQALRQVEPGAFTDRIWSLERKLYRREDV